MKKKLITFILLLFFTVNIYYKLTMSYTCKKCNKLIKYKNKLVNGYKIRYKECGCGFSVVDVISPQGESVKDIIGAKAIERMLHSETSRVKING